MRTLILGLALLCVVGVTQGQVPPGSEERSESEEGQGMLGADGLDERVAEWQRQQEEARKTSESNLEKGQGMLGADGLDERMAEWQRQWENEGKPKGMHPRHPMSSHYPQLDVLPRPQLVWAPPMGCKPVDQSCDMRCSTGYKTDAKGCHQCECLPDLCKDVTCQKGMTCRVKPCLVHPCEKTETECILDTMCSFDRAHKEDYKKHMCTHYNRTSFTHHIPECGQEGHYNPLQCHAAGNTKECWCVTNFGKEIAGTRVPVTSEASVPDCIAQHTSAMFLTFGMYHDLADDVHQHVDGIRMTVRTQLTLWMELEKGETIQVEVIPVPGQYMLVFVGVMHPSVDLVDAASKLGRHMNEEGATIKYHDTELTPDRDTITFKHHEEGERIVKCGPFVERHYRALYRRHPAIIIGGIVAVGLFVVTIAVITMAVCRRRKLRAQYQPKLMSEKSENYKENIAFGNSMIEAEEKKVPIY